MKTYNINVIDVTQQPEGRSHDAATLRSDLDTFSGVVRHAVDTGLVKGLESGDIVVVSCPESTPDLWFARVSVETKTVTATRVGGYEVIK